MKAILSASLAVLLTGSALAGTFSSTTFTGDSDIGILASDAFTHALNVFDAGNLTINGAVFTGTGGGGNPATNNYSTSGWNNGFSGFADPITGASSGLFDNFLYNGNPSVITLNNLRVGQTYETTFYNAAFGPAGQRVHNITTSLGDSLLGHDQDSSPGSLLRYTYTATSSTVTFTLSPVNPANTWHQYALSNRNVGLKALLTDNYYAPANPNTFDLNFNLPARQGGTLVAGANPEITYTAVNNTQVGNPTGGIDGGNYLLTAFFTGDAALDHNFDGADSAGGLSISFDLAPNIDGGGDPTQWGALNLGQALADKNGFVNGVHTHFGILFRGNGGIQAFDGSTVVSGAEMWGPGPNVTNALHHFELLLTDSTDGNPFDGVGQTDIATYADGALVYTFSKGGGGYADNFMNFESAGIGGVDNLVIAQIVPEPSTALALLGGVGALLGTRRRLRL